MSTTPNPRSSQPPVSLQELIRQYDRTNLSNEAVARLIVNDARMTRHWRTVLLALVTDEVRRRRREPVREIEQTARRRITFTPGDKSPKGVSLRRRWGLKELERMCGQPIALGDGTVKDAEFVQKDEWAQRIAMLRRDRDALDDSIATAEAIYAVLEQEGVDDIHSLLAKGGK